MSLALRLLAFFLAALAMILAGFSISLYWLASGYLYQQLDQRLAGTLDVLEGALHVESDGMQWKPDERHLTIGLDAGVESVRWAVRDLRERVLDVSANARGTKFPADWQPPTWSGAPPDTTLYGDLSDWRMAGRRVLLESLLAKHPDREEPDRPDEDDDEFQALELTAGLSPQLVRSTLRRLGTILATLSTAIWIACAAAGRYVCRQALAPIHQMALAARSIRAADAQRRLPKPRTGDELEQLAGAFNDLLGRLHEALEQQRRFAGDASHQLRTPLSGVLSLVDVTRRRPRSTAEYEAALDRVHQEAERMRQIIESLLFLARGESNPMLLEFKSVDLNAWLPQQLQRWSADARAEDLQFHSGHDGPALVIVQPLLLEQLLDNLLDNACKYGDPDTPIVVSTSADGERVGFSVENQSRTIADEELAHLFEPFFRASNGLDSRHTGSGLGLTIARKIAASLGGSIEAERIGERTIRFAVALPYVSEVTRPASKTGGSARK
jgi:signal transduction histidine kinase